jgi:EAL domain-containing protein (putative c-di-GMP-specific phosphodiesterase class I)
MTQATDFSILFDLLPIGACRSSGAGRQQSWPAHLREFGLEGDSVAVEITEGPLLDSSAAVTGQLLQLRDAGVQVSLDDFGTGFRH